MPISLHKSENNSGSGLQMRAIIPSLKISTPSAVLRFDCVVGRRPNTSPLFIFIVYYSTDDMAAPSTRQYNLHSSDQQTVQLPVELHMAEDSTFLKDLLASQKTPGSGQVSANDSSINDSDCEALIASSDEES